MPTYEYRCSDCAHEFEIVQKFSDPTLTDCPRCDGELRKVFAPVGVVFKGSGFYATDNRTKGNANAATAAAPADAKPAVAASSAPSAATPAA